MAQENLICIYQCLDRPGDAQGAEAERLLGEGGTPLAQSYFILFALGPRGLVDRDVIDDLVARSKLDRQAITELADRVTIDRELIAELQADGVVREEQVAGLEAALRASRTIGAALGIIVATRKVNESTAFELLKAASQRTNRKVRTLAEYILLTGDLALLPRAADAGGAGRS